MPRYLSHRHPVAQTWWLLPFRMTEPRQPAEWPSQAVPSGSDLSEVIEESRKSDERFRVALAHSRVVAFEHDTQLRYTWIYPTQFYKLDEVLGRNDLALFREEDARRLMELKAGVLRSGLGVTEEVHVTMNGQRHEYLLTVEPLRDAQKNIIGLTGASTNITAAKKAQVELANALEFRDQVIGILSHDLRNPLGAIYGWTRILLDKYLPDETRRPLLRIERSARRMTEMVSTLLDFADSRFNGSLPVLLTPTNLGEVLSGVIDELRAANPGRQIKFEVEGDAAGNWDASRLAQVASNLIANALQHGDSGGTVRTKLRALGAEVILEVANDGPPISTERIPDLFKPFQPGRALDKSPSRRLGLGLYIADQIVRAHMGSIDVRSSAATGTVFCVRLPRSALRTEILSRQRGAVLLASSDK